MITLIRHGEYSLFETKHLTKILTLDLKSVYAWDNTSGIGEILVASKNAVQPDYILALGKFRLYLVKNEPKLTNTVHIELSVGKGNWQGYLLPSGLPLKKTKTRIIPTHETITKSTNHSRFNSNPEEVPAPA